MTCSFLYRGGDDFVLTVYFKYIFVRRQERQSPIVYRPRTPPFHGGGTGSNPVGGTEVIPPLNGPVAQLVSAPPCHGGGRGFKSRQGRIGKWKASAKAGASFVLSF